MQKIRGVFTAIVTPFDQNGKVDAEGLRRNIRHQVASGVDGIVALGTTGEAPTLSHKEKELVISIAADETRGKAVLMVGTGTYSTQDTIEETKMAKNLGADAALIVAPYYNKPTQEGLYKHYKAINDAVSLPILVYNIQGRTGINIQTDTLKRIADLPSVIGVKEASGNLSQISDVIEQVGRTRINFSVMSGDDGMTLGLMALGGDGVISVVSNLLPLPVIAMVNAIADGDLNEARDLHFKLMPLIRGAFIETNPMPIKAVMQMWGMPAGNCRLPLCEVTPETEQKLKRILNNSSALRPRERELVS